MRRGSGRKPVATALKKVPISIKLPKWLIDWMDEQEESRPKLIEEALQYMNRLEPPKAD